MSDITRYISVLVHRRRDDGHEYALATLQPKEDGKWCVYDEAKTEIEQLRAEVSRLGGENAELRQSIADIRNINGCANSYGHIEKICAREPEVLTEVVTWVPVTERTPDDYIAHDVRMSNGAMRRAIYGPLCEQWKETDSDDLLPLPVTHWTERLRGPVLDSPAPANEESERS